MSGQERRAVGVIAEWQFVDSPWCDHRWRVTEVLPGPADVAPWTLLAETASVRRYFAGNAELELYPLETETLKHNLDGPHPAIYVFLRHTSDAPGIALLGATVCVGEAQAHVDTGSDLTEAVPMPEPIRAWLTAFVALHHAEKQEYRRERHRWAHDGI